MKTLLILRHAKSSWGDGNTPDHDRPLNNRGKRDAPRIGQLIRDEDLIPDLIISSTAKRARKTASKVAETCGYKGKVKETGDLYLASRNVYIRVLHDLPDKHKRVMVVGHNPGLEDLLEKLTGRDETLPTAALAQVTFEIKSWRELTDAVEGTLVNLWRPRELA